MKNLQGEVQLNIPANKAWDMFTNNEIVAKINAEMLASAEYLEGAGSPGSLRIFKFGPGMIFGISLKIIFTSNISEYLVRDCGIV
jgi:hypothetical protein